MYTHAGGGTCYLPYLLGHSMSTLRSGPSELGSTVRSGARIPATPAGPADA
jgi:hypothetical protein